MDSEKKVLGGSSAGGHLALLAGYVPKHSKLTPEELINVDISVRGILALFGSNDLVMGRKAYNLPPG